MSLDPGIASLAGAIIGVAGTGTVNILVNRGYGPAPKPPGTSLIQKLRSRRLYIKAQIRAINEAETEVP